MLRAIGPQSWYGEIESYGSGTETRYGTGAEFHTSSIAAVRPPDVEKKYVIAALPPYVSTLPDVASTAAVVDGFSELDTAVHLAARVGVDVERPGLPHGERVGARRDGLRLRAPAEAT